MTKFSTMLGHLFVLGLVLGTLNAQTPQDTTINSPNPFSANKGQISQFSTNCIANPNIHGIFKQGFSIETLIEMIGRLEDEIERNPQLQNFNNPQETARLMLQRFRLDETDVHDFEQEALVENLNAIDAAIMNYDEPPETQLINFPDHIYRAEELCAMFFMFSHYSQNTSLERSKRATYSYSGPPLRASTNATTYMEKGVVSFRNDIREAIAPGRVLTGVIAGLSDSFIQDGKQILAKLGKNKDTDAVIKDPILAVTLGNLAGSAAFLMPNNKLNEQLVFGISGAWTNNSCAAVYQINGIQSEDTFNQYKFSRRATLAEIRGGIDGYIIGDQLRKVKDRARSLKLSVILKSYYSKPHAQNSPTHSFTASYCDRQSRRFDTELRESMTAFNKIYDIYRSHTNKYQFFGDKMIDKMNEAYQVQSDACRSPGTTQDYNAPFETPSDVILFIDPKPEMINKTSSLVAEILSKLSTIGRRSGSVSMFVNSNTQSNLQFPPNTQPVSLPFGTLAYNSTSTAFTSCQLQLDRNFPPITDMGKFFKDMNQTLTNLKYVDANRPFNGLSSRTAIIIDYDTLQVPSSGGDKDQYEKYLWELKYRNRDVRFVVISVNDNKFKELVDNGHKDYEHNLISATNDAKQIATDLEKIITKNLGLLIYTGCQTKRSDKVKFEGFVSPGYAQNWALFPEYMHKSFDIEFEVKGVDGNVRFCYDREYPTNTKDRCFDLNKNNKKFHIYNPCEGHSVYYCDPIYFTIWGKNKDEMCTDPRCQSLDQIKFSITHTGVSCNSSVKLLSTFLLQSLCLFTFIFAYRRFV